MLPKNPQQWERIDRFLMSFSDKEKIAIIHDADPDGLCSAVIMAKLVERLRGKPVDIRFVPPKGTKNTIAPQIFEELKKRKISKVIFTDLACHEDAAAFKKLEKQCEILVIDHHKLFNDITSERAVLAMPQLLADDIDPSKYSSTKLAYDLANRHTNVEDLDWVAAIGTISDMTGMVWPDFLAQVFQKHNIKPNPKDWFKTEIGSISGMFLAAMAIDEKNIQHCYDVLSRAQKPTDVFKDKQLMSLKKDYDEDIGVWIVKAPKLVEHHPDMKLAWYEISPKYHVNSPVSTILSLQPKYNDWVVLVLEQWKGIVHVSGRCQSQRVAMNDLLRNVTKGLKNAAGGGHVPAAGAHVQVKDLAVFKQHILDSLGKGLYTNNEKQTTKR